MPRCRKISGKNVCNAPRANWWKDAIGIDWVSPSPSPEPSPEAQAVFDLMTDWPQEYKNAAETFIDGQVAIGQLAKIHEFWLFANDTEANSMVGWRNVVNSDFVGSPTHSPSTGITLNGSSQYISSNFIPSTHALGGEDNLAVGCFVKENLSTANLRTLFGSVPSGGAGKIGIDQVPSSAVINVFANTSTQLGVSEGVGDDKIFDSETQYTAVQLAGQAIMYKDGINISQAARTNTGLSTVEIFFGALNLNGTPFQHLNCRLCAGWVIDPAGFDFRAFHLGVKTMLQAIGVFSATPELTIPTGGEWFDFSQAALGSFSSLVGRKGLLTCLGVNSPVIESVGGVNMIRSNPSGSRCVDLASVFQAMYDHGTAGFSMLITVKPADGTPAALQNFLGHTNGNNAQYVALNTDGTIQLGFKEAAQALVNTDTDYPAFDPSPANVTILLIEIFKDDMIVFVNGIRVNQTEDSWGTRAVTDFDGGARNMYLGASNVDGVVTGVFDGHIGDFMIRSGKWSQSQKERLHEYFG